MSSGIIYEIFINKTEASVLQEQAKAFFEEKLSVVSENFQNALFERFRFSLNEDIYDVYMLTGSSNTFSYNGRPARDWRFFSSQPHYDTLRKIGFDWASDFEGGMSKLNGRWIKGEGWIKAMRRALDAAADHQFKPQKATIRVNKPTSWEEQYQLKKFEDLLTGLDFWRSEEVDRFSSKSSGCLIYRVHPKNQFEFHLFTHLVNWVLGGKWITTSEPSYGLVRKQAN